MALIDKLTAIADAIRGKTGKTDGMTLDQMVTEIEGIQTGGGGGDTTALFVEVNNNEITNFTATDKMYKLRPYMFYGNTALKSVDLSDLNAPPAGDTIDVHHLIGPYCFNGCTSLESFILPEIVASPSSRAQWLGGRSFMASGIKEFVTDYGCLISSACPQIFANCTGLKKAVIPNFRASNVANVFNGCTSLELVDINGGVIGTTWFTNCNNLKTLVIRDSNIMTVYNINAFNGTPFASGGTGGTVYCPASLISQYQQASNWSTLYAAGTCNFVAIEGSEYE